MLTRQHYKAIARIIKEAREDYRGGTPTELVLSTISTQLADYFAADNPRFDGNRFLEACAIEN